MTETIFALASGAGAAGVAVIRMSGPGSGPALVALCGRSPEPRRATLVALRHPSTGDLLDRGLVLRFPGPASFTGEDAAELQVHGSRAVVAALLDALGGLAGCRLAEPGEFTRRAFENGKLDLPAVEGLADLVAAQTEAQRRQALRQAEGGLARWVTPLHDDLVAARALVESAIDFVDESDVVKDATGQARRIIEGVAAQVTTQLVASQAAEQVRDGFMVTIAGPPNAGKSTLLNALARRDVAIVSPIPGTTRDPIEVDLDLGGFAVRIIDTAGLHATEDLLEVAGMARTLDRTAAADLVLWLQDASAPPAMPPDLGTAPVWRVGTKCDLGDPGASGTDLMLSAKTGEGLSALLERMRIAVAAALVGGETALVTRARHRAGLARAQGALERGLLIADAPELMAEHLREAAGALASLIGAIGTEEVLGAVFARFCIGK